MQGLRVTPYPLSRGIITDVKRTHIHTYTHGIHSTVSQVELSELEKVEENMPDLFTVDEVGLYGYRDLISRKCDLIIDLK